MFIYIIYFFIYQGVCWRAPVYAVPGGQAAGVQGTSGLSDQRGEILSGRGQAHQTTDQLQTNGEMQPVIEYLHYLVE